MLSHVRGKGFPACQWKRRKTHGLWVQLLSRDDPLEEGVATPQYPCLEKPMDRGAWWARVPGVAKSLTRLKWQGTQREKWFLIFYIKKEGVFVKRESPKILLLRGRFSTFLSETLNKRCCLMWICAICICPSSLSKIISSLFVELAPNLVPQVLSWVEVSASPFQQIVCSY